MIEIKGRAGRHLRGGYLDPGKGKKKKKERERDGRMDVKGRGGDRGGGLMKQRDRKGRSPGEEERAIKGRVEVKSRVEGDKNGGLMDGGERSHSPLLEL